jgi:hypothetical protein
VAAPLMSPVNFWVTVALVTFGPAGAPAGFSLQSLISNSPWASCSNLRTRHLYMSQA